MICKICGMEYKIISNSHLARKHGITPKEYLTLFPTEELYSAEVKAKLSESCKNQNLNLNFGFKKGHKTNEGKTPWNKGVTKEEDQRIKKGADRLKGITRSAETKIKLSKSMKKFYQEHPEKLPKGTKNGMYGKKLSKEHLKALWSISEKQNKPELEAEKTLCQFGFKYVGNRQFWVTFKDGTHKCPDFVHKSRKMVVEIYGDYWHKDDKPNDIIKKYADIGWTCYVFWEHEVYNNTLNPDTFAQLINEFEMEDFKYEDFDGKWMQ